MPRESPGYLINLATLWLMAMAGGLVGTGVADLLAPRVGYTVAVAVGIVGFLVGLFAVLLGYYALFLGERAPLGTPARLAFATTTARLLIVVFVVGAVFAPPDPYAQLQYLGVGLLVALPLAYWYVYRFRGGEPAMDGDGESDDGDGTEDAATR